MYWQRPDIAAMGYDQEKLESGAQPTPQIKIITFTPDDPEDPRNWAAWRKWAIIGPILFIDLTVSFAASGFSPALKSLAMDMSISAEAALLGLSLYVLGLALGPMTL